MKNIIRTLLILSAVCCFMPSLPFGLQQEAASAQTTTTQTITAAAMTATQTFINVASNTGFTASSGTLTNYVWVDGELMKLQTQVGTSTVWNVTRGVNSRGVAHPTASLVFAGPATSTGPFISQPPQPGTSCTSTNFQFLPLIDTKANVLWNCVASRWNATSLITNNDLHPVTVVTDANYSATLADEFIMYQKGTAGRTVTLPAITGIVGKVYVIAQPNNTPQTITIQGSAAQNFGSPGTASITMTTTPTRVISILMGSTWAWATW